MSYEDHEDKPVSEASFLEWIDARHPLDLTIRRVPGFIWLRLSLSLSGHCEPGHAWMYQGIVRRDTLTICGRGLVVTAMPKKEATLGNRGRTIA